MKVRTGFVSNSSSSSFIIAVPEGMEINESNMHRALYQTDNDVQFYPKYDWLHTGNISSHSVVSSVVNQIKEKGKVENLIEAVNAPYDCDLYYDKFTLPDGDPRGRYDWDAMQKLENEQKSIVAESIKAKFPNCDFYEVEFSDNDGNWNCEVEHGPALNSCNNVIRFSHH
jgi:hypothetical protein